MRQRSDGRLGASYFTDFPSYASHDIRGLAVGDATGDGKPDVALADHERGLIPQR